MPSLPATQAFPGPLLQATILGQLDLNTCSVFYCCCNYQSQTVARVADPCIQREARVPQQQPVPPQQPRHYSGCLGTAAPPMLPLQAAPILHLCHRCIILMDKVKSHQIWWDTGEVLKGELGFKRGRGAFLCKESEISQWRKF